MAVLGPHLAASYVAMFLGKTLEELIYKSNGLIKEKGSYEMLEVLHHLSSGFKSYVTDYCYVAMDEMRQACGGAGFHMASGVASNWANNAPLVTYEGVNTVMMQQSSRLLLKQTALLAQGKKCVGYMAYLNDTEKLLRGKSHARNVEDFLQIEHLERALATRAVYQLAELTQAMASSKASDQEKTNDIFAVDILLASKLHIEFCIFEFARDYYKNHTFTDTRIRPILDLLVKIVAVKMLMKDSEGLYETGFFGVGASRL